MSRNTEATGASVDADSELGALHVGDRRVATYRSGADVPAHLAPRPFLHPVTTLRGTPVTDCRPEDHHWHLGVSLAVQDVAGNNLWGGRTYVRDLGYQWREDHGAMRHDAWIARAGGHLAHRVRWFGRDGAPLVRETRTLDAHALPAGQGWTLTWRSLLEPAGAAAVALGSPGTNGRHNAGYGGFFWRLPLPAGAVTVFTADAEGEDAVHGRPAPWLAFAAAAAAPDTAGSYTLLFEPDDPRTAGDPWFVRVSGYPGVGSALAFDEVLTLEPGTTTTVGMRVHVLDERLDRAGASALRATAPRTTATEARSPGDEARASRPAHRATPATYTHD